MIGTSPGELVLHSLLKQFASICQCKVEGAIDDKVDNDLVKCMRLQEDTAFQQLLAALHTCAEHALPCLLQTINKWYDTQHSSGALYPFRRVTSKTLGTRCHTLSAATGHAPSLAGGHDLLIRSMHVEGSSAVTGTGADVTPGTTAHPGGTVAVAGESGNIVLPLSATFATPQESNTIKHGLSTSVRENMAERRDLCIDILYCQALTSVLKQLPYHPGHDEIINRILDRSFKHFEYKENLQAKPNAENINTVADMYAKVVGELSQTRFNLVRQHFSTRLEHLRAKESSSHTMHSIISLLMGMKFFRVKMHPIEEFVSYFTFLHELGQYFLEVKEKEIRHAMTCLFVEILLPVAAVVRHEVNIPALKNFVDLLYNPAFELANKKKHALALFPMVTCLLCVSTKAFFLNNWPPFMSLCLSQLKNRDLGQVSVESLFRLLWVYVVRIKCEKHADTQNKLLSIVNGLFPKGSKSVLPKNVSSTVFVKIIHFIAQEKLDFAMTEIIFDLLGVNRLQKLVFTPERMNIGLRAFLLIAHGLQQKDGEPPMPQNQPLAVCGVGGVNAYPSVHSRGPGNVRRSFHGTTLDDALCERLGIRPYLVPVRKAFEAILRLLEPQVCRSMMPPKQGAPIKDDDAAPGDRKPKIDLLKTCVNCIPRLLPYEMSRTELIELLARVSLNVDEEIRMMAQQTMVNLIIESPAYRQRTIQAFIQFIQKYVPDTAPHQLDSCLKTLHTLLVNWKIALQRDAAVTTSLSEKSALVEAEGFALVMLCQCRPLARRLAVHILRESRAVLRLINQAAAVAAQQQQEQGHEDTIQNVSSSTSAAAASNISVIDILDSLAPAILERVLPLLPPNERHDLATLSTVDFKSLAERATPVWLCGPRQPSTWNHKPVLGSTNIATSTAPSYVQRFGSSGLGTSKNSSDQTSGPKASLSATTTITPTRKPSLETSPGRGGRKSQAVPPAPHTLTGPTALRPSAFSQCLLSPYILQPQLERTQLTDVWATVLAVSLSTSSALSLHPAMLYTWNTAFQRLTQVFSLIDPNAQAAENRASSLLRSTSKKAPPSERDQLLPLWHNYVTLACCIAPSSTGVCVVDRSRPTYDTEFASTAIRRRNALKHISNPSTGSADIALLPSYESSAAISGSSEFELNPGMSPRQHQRLVNSKLFISAKEKARDLVKLIIPLLRCDHPELRESIICGLSRIQPGAFRDVLEDLHPILRESIDLKQKNVQRRRRRDTLRSSLIRLLALMAQNAVFQHDEAGITSGQGTLLPTLLDFIEGTRVYLESLNEPSAMVVTMFSSSTATATTAFGVGHGGPATVVAPSTSVTTVTAPSLPSATTAAVATSMNSPVGTSPGGGLMVGAVATCGVSGAPASTVGGASGGAGGSGSGSGGIGAGGGPAGVSGGSVQNPSVAAAATTPSATAAASAAPAHAPTGVDPMVLTEMRLYFCVFIRDLIRHLPRERRQRLLPPATRRNLVLLIARWSGFYEHIHNNRDAKWGQPPWTDHFSGSLTESKYANLPLHPPPPPLPSVGMDQVISGDLVLSISGVHLDSTPQDPFIAASFLDNSIWLELLWYANQSIAALVCCGAIYDTLALFTTPTATHRVVESSETALSGSGVGNQFHQISNNTSVTACTGVATSTPSSNAASSTTMLASGVMAEEECGPLTLSTIATNSLVSTPAQTLNSVSLTTPIGPGFSSSEGQPAPGYIFHWLKGLLLCQDGKLSISPWLWGLPVVNFGVCSTALKGPHAKTGARNIRLEDSLRSIVIAAAAGRRLDSLFRQLGEETLTLLLDMNCDLPGLLEILVDQCYTGSLNVIQAFFVIITQHFIKNPKTHCDKFTMLTLAMVFCEHTVPVIRENAMFLLQTLYYRFILLVCALLSSYRNHFQPVRELHQRMHPECQKMVTSTPVTSISGELNDSYTEMCLSALADEMLWREIGHWKPCDVLRQFCAQHPTYTLPMVSEICRRLATASSEVRCRLINLLHYWTINIELVDLFTQGSSSKNNTPCGDGFIENYSGCPEDASTVATLEPISPSGRTDAVTTSEPSSGSDVEIEGESVNKQHSSISSNSSVSSSPASSISSSDSSSSCTSNSTSISTDSSNIDLGECGSGAQVTSNLMELRKSRRDHKPNHRLHRNHEETRLRNQRRILEHSFKPVLDGEGQKSSELWASVPLTLRRSGYGCLKATEMVLNNFFYLTIRFANEPNEASVLGDLWVLLIRYRPANLQFILRYLIVVASLAPATLCSHVNRVVSFLTNEDPSSVVDVLMAELQTIDGAGLMIEPLPFPPFFHIAFLSDLIEHSFTAPTGVTNAATTTTGSVLTVTTTEDRQRRNVIPETITFSQRSSVMTVDPDCHSVSARPVSSCSGGWQLNGGDDETAIVSLKSTVEASPLANTTSAISRLTNRFASSATAMGRRALRTALHPGGGRQSKTSVTLDQGQPQELDIDSLDGEVEEECRGARTTADTMPTPQNQNTTTAEALITAKSQTLPYTAASRERYNKQAIVSMDGTPLSRPSRLRKILSRRRAAAGEKGGSGGGRRNPFRSMFRGSGGGGGGSGGRGDATKISEIVAKVSDSARLYTTSLPPNLASLQPLPLPLHSHSISHINDYRRKRKGGRHRCSSPRNLRRHHGNAHGDGDVNQRAKVPLSDTSLLLQQPLPMPKEGNVYHAPLRDWFTEPFVTNGSLVFSGMWSPTGARSPLVLVLVGEILKSHNKHRVAWRKHMPLLLLCLFLGLDHCRPLVQEESKQLLVNMLRVICPRIDLLRLLSLQLEIDSQWIAHAMHNFSLRGQQFCLTLDDGPSVPKFYLPAPTDAPLTEVSNCPIWSTCCVPNSSSIGALAVTGTPAAPSGFGTSATPPTGLSPLTDAPPLIATTSTTSGGGGILSRSSLVAHQPTASRPSYVFGSTYSLMSTATLIPAGLSMEQESKRRSVVLSDLPPPPSSSQPPTSSAHTVGEAGDKSAAMSMDEMAVVTAPFDCEAKHLHLAAERIGQLLEEVQDRSIWTWEDITPNRFQQATLVTLRSILPPHPSTSPQLRKSFLLLRSACFLDRFVRCVAEAFAEAEAGCRCEEAASCLCCHHGDPHRHSNDGGVGESNTENLGGGGPSSDGSAFFLFLRSGCTITRFAQAAFNMGITCPNRHYASRSLQIYRALDAQLDEKSLSEVLVRLAESISDTSEELQSYMVELFLTLEAAVGHIQCRGTVLSPFIISNGQFAVRSRSSAPNSPLVTSKPPQPPQSASPLLLTPQAPPPTPPVHERRHSRRGSSSSLSSLLGYPASIVGTAVVPTPSLVPIQQNTGLTVPPIKRPLMPPHAEAVSEETDVALASAPSTSALGPVKPTPMPPFPPNAYRSSNNTGVVPVATNDARHKFNFGDPVIDRSAVGTCRLAPEEQADLLAGIFWIGVCLLDSDYEYEYFAGIRLLSRLLPCVCSPLNTTSTTATTAPTASSGNRKWSSQHQQHSFISLHDHVLRLLHRLKWTTGTEDGDYPGLLGLLLKGCFSSTLIDTSCRLLVHLIPAVKSPIVDPNAEIRQYRRAAVSGTSRSTGSSTSYPGILPTLVIVLLPMLLTAWDEDPDSPASTVPEPAISVGEVGEACAEGSGSPAVTSSFSPPSSSSLPPPLGSWVHRSVVISETAAPSPSSGLLSLITTILVSGAVAKKAPQLRPRNPICTLAAEQLAELALQMDAYRFNNLAIVLRLYANGTFSKDVNQWAKCVTRYLMDGCAGLGPRILTFLTPFLTLGPPCVQLSLLHFGYWFLQAVELNQSEMGSRIRAFITATSERFVNTPLWPEVTLLYQVVVARSAVLTAAPSNPEIYSLPGLDPSGSGRVLDSLAAAAAAAVPLPEAEPQRIALAGRVLDFDSSVLQSAPLIAGGRGQASPRLGAISVTGQSQHRSPARASHLVEICGLSSSSLSSFFRLGAWKTPWNRQARLRGLFANLLSCYGSELDHLTAPRSPSNSSKQKVIFSQSTETLDRQLSMHSSSETTSINDTSNPDDGHFDDTSSAERAAVFHDLDTYLDAQLMNINFLDLPDTAWEDQSRCPWGVRGHSITSHTEFHEEGDDQQQSESQTQSQKQPDQVNQAPNSFGVSEDIGFPNIAVATEEPLVSPPSITSQHQSQHLPEGEELEVDVEEEEDDEYEEEEDEELERGGGVGGNFLAVGASTLPEAATERQSQLSLQLSVSSSAVPAAVSDSTPNAALLAPSTLHRKFNSQLLIAWTSRDDSPVKWLTDASPTADVNVVNAADISSVMQTYQGTQSIPRKLTLPMHPRAVCSRRRLQALTTFGGSLESLPSQPNVQSTTVIKPRSCVVPRSFQQSSSAFSFAKVPAITSNGMTDVDATGPPIKPPRRHRRFRRSLELGTQQQSDLSRRISRSSNALIFSSEDAKAFSTTGITPQQLLIPVETPSETAWMACQRQFKSFQQSSIGVAMGSAQADRLHLLLTSLRSTFSGMLRRTTLQAVKLANLAFCRCPPGSDLDPEIRISNLIKIADAMGDALPLPFFALHPNCVALIDEHSVSLCLEVGTSYEEWEDAMRQLAVTCASSGTTQWLQHERICRDLQEVLRRLLLFFRSSTDLLTSTYRHLVNPPLSVTDFTSSGVEPLFARLRSYILAPPPSLPPNSQEIGGMEAWRARCARLLLWPPYGSLRSEEVDAKRALAIYAAAMKSKAPISMDDVMTILEACCEYLWTGMNCNSGVALMFAQGPTIELHTSEAFASATSTVLAPTLFFTTDDLLTPDGQATLSPLELVDRLLRLLEA